MSSNKKSSKDNQLNSKKMPLAFWVIITGLIIIVIFYGLWFWLLRVPNPQTVFYQTLDQNLKTQNLTSTTEINTVLNNAQFNLSTSTLKMDLKNNQLSYSQTSLRDFILANKNTPLSEADQIHYSQQIFQDKSNIYFQHDVSPQRYRQAWEQARPAYGSGWYQIKQTSITQPLDNFNLYLMTIYLTNGIGFAHLNDEQRQVLINELKSIYVIDFNNVDQSRVDGRLLYTYKVQLKPQAFENFIESYVNLHASNPDQKHTKGSSTPFAQNFSYTITIDALSRRITQIEYDFVWPVLSGYSITEIISVWPHYSDLLPLFYNRLPIKITTKIISQDAKQPLLAPDQFQDFFLNIETPEE